MPTVPKAIAARVHDGLNRRPIDCDLPPSPISEFGLTEVYADSHGRLWVHVAEAKQLRMIFDPRDAPT